MKNIDNKDPRFGMIVSISVLLAALWLVIAFGAYEDAKQEKSIVRVTPGAVRIGTRPTTTMPTIATPTRRSGSVPMVSGDAVRNYAHYGHSAMPSATSGSGMKMHTTSSARLHSYGAGGNGGGGMMSSAAGASSSRGINYGSPSISMPVLALNTRTTPQLATSTYAAEATTVVDLPRGVMARKAAPSDPGVIDGQAGQDDTDPNVWWIWDDEEGEWRTPVNGDSRIDGENTYEFQGGKWVLIAGPGDPAPVGATPWLLMSILAAAYVAWKYRKSKA